MRNLVIALVLVIVLVLVVLALVQDSQDNDTNGAGQTGSTTVGSVSGNGEGVTGSNGGADPDDPTQVGTPNGSDNPDGDDGTTVEVARTIRGVIQDEAGEPVESAQLRFVVHPEEETAVANSHSDEEGKFELGLPEDVGGMIEVKCEKYATVSVPWTPPVANPEDPAESEDLVIVLSAQTAIAGVVTLPADHETTEFMIVIQKYSGPRSYHEPVQHEFDSEDGSYYAETGPGNRRVWAYARGTYRSVMTVVPLAEGEQRLDIDFTLEPGCDVAGQCYEKQSGRPIKGVLAYAPVEHVPGTVDFLFRSQVHPKVANATRSSDAGTFQLRDLPPGEHLLRFLHPDYKPVDRVVTLVRGTNQDLEIALEEGTGIVGEVLDSEGQPPEEAMVLAIIMGPDMETGQQSGGRVDEDGQYAIRNLAPGSYIVVLIDESANTGQPRFTMSQVNPERDTVVDFVDIAEKATVRGKVVNQEGDAVPNTQLLFMSGGESDFTFKSCITDAEGLYEIRNLALGRHQIGVSPFAGGTFAVAGSITLEQAKDYEKDVEFYDLTFSGVVRDAVTKRPVRGEVLLLAADAKEGSPDEFQGRAEYGEDGRFEIVGLTPGKYTAMALSQGYQPSMCEPFDVDTKGKTKVDIKFDLIVGGTVEVLVLDANGQPVDAALVTIFDGSGEQANPGLPPLTASGVYRFANLMPGAFTMRVKPQEGDEVVREFVARAGKTTKVEIRLP